jgi:uncharacterized protein (DUF2132 family)
MGLRWKQYSPSWSTIMVGKNTGKIITIRCFNSDPSIKSRLKFLRKTPWARAKVEKLYLSL